jgi:putative transposase
MTCPHCNSTRTRERRGLTKLGYRRFTCRDCGRRFNERTGTAYNWLQYPTDIVLLVVLWRLRYKLSLRDLAERFLERGFVFTHETVREWDSKLAPRVADELRKRRRGVVGESWYVDETYIKVDGRWCYLYRAIDRNGHLVDVRLSETRDLAAAKAFFRSARAVTGVTPDRVTSDGHRSYPRAIACELGEDVTHRTNPYLNNHLEQDHRGIKQRVRPLLGFKRFTSAARFCLAHDELRNFLRPTTARNEKVSLAQRRLLHTRRLCVLTKLLKAA